MFYGVKDFLKKEKESESRIFLLLQINDVYTAGSRASKE